MEGGIQITSAKYLVPIGRRNGMQKWKEGNPQVGRTTFNLKACQQWIFAEPTSATTALSHHFKQR